ncbi:putative CDK inhibitor P21 binding protein [Forsythia ovata]|uniref:CDK inhibitor P21 binding protein n=1 Tax=Forsythia ovata TaxID=205694 RepID=A0ABD1W8F5_9LAMI
MARAEVQYFSREEEEVEIHGDILEAILLYVPLIDLVPASSVSKSWCSVVASSLRHLKKPKPWLVIHKQANRSPYAATTTHAYDPCSNQWIKISQPSIKFISALKSLKLSRLEPKILIYRNCRLFRTIFRSLKSTECQGNRLRRQLIRRRPFTFSPFGRSMATVASISKARHKMPGSKLQTKNSPSSSGNGYHHVVDKNEQWDSSDGEEFDGAVQADFTFFDPKPGDFHGVKVLLQTYLVGTVVKIENDEDDGVYSVITALNLGRYQDNKCMIELKEYLLKVCQGKDVLAKLRSLMGEHVRDVGLLVSQRVVNLPPQLLPPLYDALFDEVSWATEDEPTEELRSSFRFKFYLIISKIYKTRFKGPSRSEDEAIIYIKPEDEIFHELSSWSFSFPLPAQQVTTNELKNYQLMGLMMAIEASKVSAFRKQLHLLIDEE